MLVVMPRVAWATEVRILSRTVGEGYTVRLAGPGGQLLARRRLAQYVNLGVYRILPPKRPDELVRAPEDGQLRIVTSMRLRHDFGAFTRSAGGDAARLLETLDGRQIDLMVGYLEGVGIGRWIDFRVGRQLEMSGLDFYVFDGGFVRARTPAYFAVEVFGGFQVDGQAVFGYPEFEFDGTQGTSIDRTALPMVGAAIALDRVPIANARIAYRRTWSPDSINEERNDIDGYDVGSIVHQEIISATANVLLAKRQVSLFAAGRYNMGVYRIDDLQAGVTATIAKRHVLRAEYLRTIPSFDLNSIFNVFAIEPFQDIRASYEIRPNQRWTLGARFQGRIFESDPTTEGETAERPVAFGAGGGASAALQRRRFAMRIDGYGLGGYGGLRIGGSIDTRTNVIYDRVALDGRVYAIGYRDELNTERNGYSVAIQAGVDVHLAHGVSMNVVADETLSPTLQHSFRLFGMLTIDWAFRAGQRG